VLSAAALQKSSLPSPPLDALDDTSPSSAAACGTSAEPSQLAMSNKDRATNDQRPRNDVLGVMGVFLVAAAMSERE
jgi:hypothetical protein